MAFTTLDTNSSLSPADAHDLARTARWARITAIAGGAWLLVMLAAGGLTAYILYQRMKMMAQAQEALGLQPSDPLMSVLSGSIVFLIIVALYVMPIVFLFQYAQRTLRALRTGFDAAMYSDGLRAQRNLFTYVGVLAMVMFAGTLVVMATMAFTLLAPPEMAPPADFSGL
jgi:hypothetical protein